MDRWNLQCDFKVAFVSNIFSLSVSPKTTACNLNLNLLSRKPDNKKSKIECASFIQKFCPNAKVFDLAYYQFMNMCAVCKVLTNGTSNSEFDSRYNAHVQLRSSFKFYVHVS